MTLQDILNRSVPALIGLADQLEAIAAQYPDSEPSLRPKIEALRSAADPLRLADLAAAVVRELTDLVRTGQIQPKQHPSDLAG